MPPSEEDEQQALDKWIAAQPTPPTIWEVLESRNVRLFTAFVTRGFRQAAAEAVEETKRVERVREVVREAYGGDCAKMEEFLRRGNPALGGDTPLQRTVRSEAGAEEVIQLVRRTLYGGGF